MTLYDPKVEGMYAHLEERLKELGFKQSLKALEFVREAYIGKFRKSGAPAIIHPLSMACFALGFKGVTDRIIAIILLHDVCEDCGKELSELPVDDTIRYGVELMTIKEGQDKVSYFNGLLDLVEAAICKGFDRYNNLNDADGALPEEAIVKNIYETYRLLLPVLERAMKKYPEFLDTLCSLFITLRNTLKMMADKRDIELK